MKICLFRVVSCAIFIVPCHYIWLYYLSPVDDHLFEQYRFGCVAVALSCIIELLAEVPSFVAQVNCELKLKVALDCIHLTVRSVIFVYLIKSSPADAIRAFGIAQIVSVSVFVTCFYCYYYASIRSKKQTDRTIALLSIHDMFPFLRNEVYFCSIND